MRLTLNARPQPPKDPARALVRVRARNVYAASGTLLGDSLRWDPLPPSKAVELKN
jgi:hypothetical protein